MGARTSNGRRELALVLILCGCAAPDRGVADLDTTSVGSSSSAESSSTSTSDEASSTSAANESSTGEDVLLCGASAVVVPSFASPEAVPAQGRLVGMFDVDADENLDAVLLAPGSSAEIVLGAGNGSWGDVVTIPGGPLLALALAELDGEVGVDLAAAGGSPYELTTLLGNADGTFDSTDVVDLGGSVPLTISSLDADVDGDDDLLIAVDGAAQLARNDGGFSATTIVTLEGDATLFAGDIAHGDLDGLPGDDVVLHGAFVLASDGSGGFTNLARLATAGGYATVGDFDGVGPSDIVITKLTDSPSGFGSLSIGSIDANGVDDLVEILPTCEWCVRDKPTAADVNGDAAIDLVYPSSDGVGILLGCGDGTFAGPLYVELGGPLHRVLVVDVDADQHADLVTTRQGRAGELVIARGAS